MPPSTITYIYFNTKYGETPAPKSVELYYEVEGYRFYDTSLSDLPQLTHPSLIFDGWYSSDTFEESSKLYENSYGEVISPNGSLQLYAKWKSIPVYCGSMELFEIANAIREKTGETGEIMLNDMKDKITSIKTESPYSTEENTNGLTVIIGGGEK